jgi:hypothetical protein
MLTDSTYTKIRKTSANRQYETAVVQVLSDSLLLDAIVREVVGSVFEDEALGYSRPMEVVGPF